MDPSNGSNVNYATQQDYAWHDSEHHASVSPETGGDAPFTFSSFDPFLQPFDISRLFEPVRGHLAQSVSSNMPATSLFAPVIGAPQRPMMASSFSRQHPGQMRFAPPQQLSMIEEGGSTDATPESSDIEEDNRVRRNKRNRPLLNEAETSVHAEEAQRFPTIINHLRERLYRESPEGHIAEKAAVSALVVEFTRNRSFRWPYDCEQWFKQAAETVQIERQRGRGMIKKKSSDRMSFDADGNPRFVCQLCAEEGEMKDFKTQEGLHLHTRNKHEEVKPWRCYAPNCSVSFVRQADLRMHLLRMHSPERPFPCKVPFCVKAFAGVSELRRHVKVDHHEVVCKLCATPQLPETPL